MENQKKINPWVHDKSIIVCSLDEFIRDRGDPTGEYVTEYSNTFRVIEWNPDEQTVRIMPVRAMLNATGVFSICCWMHSKELDVLGGDFTEFEGWDMPVEMAIRPWVWSKDGQRKISVDAYHKLTETEKAEYRYTAEEVVMAKNDNEIAAPIKPIVDLRASQERNRVTEEKVEERSPFIGEHMEFWTCQWKKGKERARSFIKNECAWASKIMHNGKRGYYPVKIVNSLTKNRYNVERADLTTEVLHYSDLRHLEDIKLDELRSNIIATEDLS